MNSVDVGLETRMMKILEVSFAWDGGMFLVGSKSVRLGVGKERVGYSGLKRKRS
jgi:hypothetical protein